MDWKDQEMINQMKLGHELQMIDVLTPYGKALQSVTLIGTEEYWRMHYAGLAMQGVLAHGYANTPRDTREYIANEISKGAFEIADAMIKQSKVSQ